MLIYVLLGFIFLIICFSILYQNILLKRRCDSTGVYFMGNGTLKIFKNLLRGVTIVDQMSNIYNELKKSGFKVGLSTAFNSTVLQVHDPEILKQILVKDFEHFADHRQLFGSNDNDYTLKRMLFILTGERWKQMRSKLSPTFTTGKIKRIFSRFDKSGEKFVTFLANEVQSSGGERELDLSLSYSKYAMDVIASAVIGIDSHAFNQKEMSKFETMGQLLQFDLSAFGIFRLICITTLPLFVTNFFGMSMMSRKGQDFFATAIKYSMEDRLKKGEKREDFLQLMLEARDGKLKTEEGELESFEKDAQLSDDVKKIPLTELLDEDGIIASCIQFFFAGFDTLQSLLQFASYELALNQDVQEKLRNEINTVLETTNGEYTYEGVGRMVYLDMVISETLRRWPPAAASDRLCVKDYKVPGTEFILKKGEGVDLLIYGQHMDSDNFPNPKKFDPERFSPENRPNINPYTYLPFGQGPRNCIGMRFALTEAKVVISQLVRNFQIQPSAKTSIPIEFKNTGSLKPKNGMYLSLTKITT